MLPIQQRRPPTGRAPREDPMTKLTRRAFAASAAAAAAGISLAKPAFAQAYPNRPVTVVVPWGAGGGTDATARIVAALLEKDLGQPFEPSKRVMRCSSS